MATKVTKKKTTKKSTKKEKPAEIKEKAKAVVEEKPVEANDITPTKEETPAPPAPPTPPKPSIPPAKRTFSQWAKFKKNEDLAIGASIRFDLDPAESLTEAEYDGFINKFLKS